MDDSTPQERAVTFMEAAKNAINDGNLTRARQLLLKSLSLYETGVASDLLMKVEARLLSQQKQQQQEQTQQSNQHQQAHQSHQQTHHQQHHQQHQQQHQRQRQEQEELLRQRHQHQQHQQKQQQQQQQQQQRQYNQTQSQSNARRSTTSSQSQPPKQAESTASPKPSSSSLADLPQDDEQACKLIATLKTHYSVLFLSHTCTEQEIKLNYRKLALRFHPDKCQVSMAEDTFKIISTAYGVLSDTTERRKYDMLLTSGRASSNAQQFRSGDQFFFNRGQQSHGGGGARFEFFNEDMTAEDIFNMFVFPQAARQRQQQQQQHQHQQRRPAQRRQTVDETDGWGNYLHFLPLIVMLLFSILALIPSQQDTTLYSLTKFGKFQVPMKTPHLGVDFYISRDVDQLYKKSPSRVDMKSVFKTIEEEHIDNAKSRCHSALSQRLSNADKYCDQWRAMDKTYHAKVNPIPPTSEKP